MYKNSFVHYLAKTLVDIMFYGGILCTLLVSLIVKWAQDYFLYNDAIVIPFSIVLYTSGAAAVYILFNLKRMFKTLLNGNPFVQSNVSCLRRMSAASFIIVLIYIAKCFFWFTIASAIIIIVFVIAGLFCLTLKDVFKQAIYYKEENDFTV